MERKPLPKLWRREMAWAVYGPSGRLELHSISDRQSDAIAAVLGGKNVERWPDFEAAGYQCRRVSIYPGAPQ